ncbi:MAG: hypothetical protein QXL47_00005, partial [Candidatus Anstonellales archaeon]
KYVKEGNAEKVMEIVDKKRFTISLGSVLRILNECKSEEIKKIMNNIINDAKDLYEYLFPNADEREEWEVIIERLNNMLNLQSSKKLKEQYGDCRFYVSVMVDKGKVIAYSQFTTLPLDEDKLIVYWEYAGIADKDFMNKKYKSKENYFRDPMIIKQGYDYVLWIASENAKKMNRRGGVAGIIMEAEMIGQVPPLEKGQKPNKEDIVFTKLRLQIHNFYGGMRIVMIEKNDGTLINPHIQPSLGAGKKPIQLHLLYRPMFLEPGQSKKREEIDAQLAKKLITAYLDYLGSEESVHESAEEVRRIVNERFKVAARVVLIPPDEIPNIIELAKNDPLLKQQIDEHYGKYLKGTGIKLMEIFADIIKSAFMK